MSAVGGWPGCPVRHRKRSVTNKTKKQEQYIEPAKRYVDQQLETMRKHGAAPNLSAEAYNSRVSKVAKATAKINPSCGTCFSAFLRFLAPFPHHPYMHWEPRPALP
jgi:hypothetical protein